MSITLAFGHGTEIIEGTPEIQVLEAPAAESDPPRVQITMTITVKTTVMVARRIYCCDFCGSVPPMPDAQGARYILRTHDGERTVIPMPEACTLEEQIQYNDRYPVTGWKTVRIGDLKKWACPKCLQRIIDALL